MGIVLFYSCIACAAHARWAITGLETMAGSLLKMMVCVMCIKFRAFD